MVAMAWGVFIIENEKERHVVPVTDDGEIVPPHTLSLACVCNPASLQDGKAIVVHEWIN